MYTARCHYNKYHQQLARDIYRHAYVHVHENMRTSWVDLILAYGHYKPHLFVLYLIKIKHCTCKRISLKSGYFRAPSVQKIYLKCGHPTNCNIFSRPRGVDMITDYTIVICRVGLCTYLSLIMKLCARHTPARMYVP